MRKGKHRAGAGEKTCPSGCPGKQCQGHQPKQHDSDSKTHSHFPKHRCRHTKPCASLRCVFGKDGHQTRTREDDAHENTHDAHSYRRLTAFVCLVVWWGVVFHVELELEMTQFGGRLPGCLANRFGCCLDMHDGIFDNAEQGPFAPFNVQG